MKVEKVKGFLKVIVASTATEGVSFLWVQIALHDKLKKITIMSDMSPLTHVIGPKVQVLEA